MDIRGWFRSQPLKAVNDVENDVSKDTIERRNRQSSRHLVVERPEPEVGATTAVTPQMEAASTTNIPQTPTPHRQSVRPGKQNIARPISPVTTPAPVPSSTCPDLGTGDQPNGSFKNVVREDNASSLRNRTEKLDPPLIAQEEAVSKPSASLKRTHSSSRTRTKITGLERLEERISVELPITKRVLPVQDLTSNAIPRFPVLIPSGGQETAAGRDSSTSLYTGIHLPGLGCTRPTIHHAQSNSSYRSARDEERRKRIALSTPPPGHQWVKIEPTDDADEPRSPAAGCLVDSAYVTPEADAARLMASNSGQRTYCKAPEKPIPIARTSTRAPAIPPNSHAIDILRLFASGNIRQLTPHQIEQLIRAQNQIDAATRGERGRFQILKSILICLKFAQAQKRGLRAA